MMFFIVLTLLSCLAHAAFVKVAVGKNETTGGKGPGFDPSVITPQTGDMLVFEFRSGAHNVVASSFDNPCTASDGFESGIVSVSNNWEVDAPGLPTINVRVNSTDSLWFFDSESGACDEGAVLAVNPTSDETVDEFVQNAMGATGESSTTGESPNTSEPSFSTIGSAAITSSGRSSLSTGLTNTRSGTKTSTGAESSATGDSDSSISASIDFKLVFVLLVIAAARVLANI